MDKAAYLAIAISILVSLLIVFIVSFVLYRKTPVPKECKDISDENCAACGHTNCPLYKEGKDK